MYSPMIGPAGELISSDMPKELPSYGNPLQANGLLIRGVVVATYYLDDNGEDFSGARQTAVMCDVIAYGAISHLRNVFIPRCLVAQERSGVHEGDIWVPRPTTMNMEGKPLDLNSGTNPADMDGDHVLVGFMDGDLSQPVILRSIPHPSADKGGTVVDAAGQRVSAYQRDGQPRLWRHHGAFWGVDTKGNAILDLSRAYTGGFEPNGTEPNPTLDGESGSYKIRLPTQSDFTVEIISDPDDPENPSKRLAQIQLTDGTMTVSFSDGSTLLLTGKDAATQLTIGNGAVHPAIVEHLQTLWGQLKTYIETATVLTALGPSGPVVGNSGPAPAWNTNINSSKVSMPDG